MPSPFSSLASAPPDPVFDLMLEARKAGPAGIDATAGVLFDDEGHLLVLETARESLKEYAASLSSETFGYPPLLGLPAFRDCTETLIFGETDRPITASIATTGGSGALAVAMRLLLRLDPNMRLLFPEPTWANHAPLVRDAGLPMQSVPYLDLGGVAIDQLTEAIKAQTGPHAILLQAGCHNPSGRDPSPEEWEMLATAMAARGTIALLDCAYLGFAEEPERDMEAERIMRKHGIPTIITWSASKNHAIYGLRTGLCSVVVPDETTKKSIESHLSTITRGIHSAAPTVGQHLVTLIQTKHRAAWLDELRGVRADMTEKRRLLIESFSRLPASFVLALEGHGMFALLPLTPEQSLILKRDHQVFLGPGGRINVAGIRPSRIEELTKKIASVL